MKRLSLLVSLFLLLLLVTGGLAVTDTEAPHLFSASPASASNADTKTIPITLTGSGFVPGIKGAIYPCLSPPQYGTVTYVSPSQVTLNYRFYGQTAGNWHIRLQNPDGDVTEVYPFLVTGTSSTTTTTTSSATGSTTVTTTTTTTPETGKNSVYFETNPTGATIYLNDENIGTSSFTYYTDKDGTFSVVAKKDGYAVYEDRVTIVEGRRIRFYALLTPLSSTVSPAITGIVSTTGTTRTGSVTPGKNATTTRKFTPNNPTPLGPDPTFVPESPVDPAIALWAAGIGIILVVIRRR